jgi:hypothetical protein
MKSRFRNDGTIRWLERILANLRDHAEHPERYVGMTEKDVADAKHDVELLVEAMYEKDSQCNQ